jgi:NAD-dependent deacetylase
MPDLTRESGSKLDQVASLVLESEYVVALAGAGLSVASGIPPFRGPGGIWNRHGEPPTLAYREFVCDPKLWWERRLHDEVEPGNPVYEMKLAADRAIPNAGHYALVALEQLGILKHTITQNVDNLHRQAGSIALTEIHGNRTLLRCIDCEVRRPRKGFPLEVLPPRCPECGGVIKLDTVMFGEPIPQGLLWDCREQVGRCDGMLLIGTSGVVSPAAQLPVLARARDAWLVEINPHQTALTDTCDLVWTGSAGELLPLLVEHIRQRWSSSTWRY